MSFEKINFRQQVPDFKIYVQNDQGILTRATPSLYDEVREDIISTRERVLDNFPNGVPSLSNKSKEGISAHFVSNQWSLPLSVVVDPRIDIPNLRSIIDSSKFSSVSNGGMFVGESGLPASPGVWPELDLVLFHDWRDKYRSEMGCHLNRWGYRIRDVFLEEAVEIKIADLVVHEYSHIAGALAVKAVVLKKIDGKYKLLDGSNAGFVDISNGLIGVPQFDDASGYYVGPVLDESWPAMQSSAVVMGLMGCDKSDFAIEDSYSIFSTLLQDGEEVEMEIGRVHSSEAGIIIETLDSKYPGIIDAMNSAANGEITTLEAINRIKSLVPSEIFKLLNIPSYNAWMELMDMLGVQYDFTSQVPS